MTDKLRFACLIGVLVVSTVDLRWMSHSHAVPPRRDFSDFPTEIHEWSGKDLPDLSAGVKKVLAADNYVLRDYHNNVTGEHLDLFIAYYSSQRSGDAIHSPKNCLPGAGWQPISSQAIWIQNPSIPGSSFKANHYVIEKDGAQQEVLYWYEAHGRKFASEYLGKIYLAWDGITSGRTDGALIRITADRTPENNGIFREMVAFAQDELSILPRFLPN